MNSEQNFQEHEVEPVEQKLSTLNSVTPLSKYLAMILFIVMPFVGGWIGYTYSPEKVVEVEKIVTIEVQGRDKNLNNLTENPAEIMAVGEKYSKINEAESSSTILYKNETYGYTLTLPESWKGYRIHKRNVDTCNCSEATSVGINNIEDAIIIEVYTKKEWNTLLEERGDAIGLIPVVLGENETYIFAGWNGVKDYDDLVANPYPSILNTFSLIKN